MPTARPLQATPGLLPPTVTKCSKSNWTPLIFLCNNLGAEAKDEGIDQSQSQVLGEGVGRTLTEGGCRNCPPLKSCIPPNPYVQTSPTPGDGVRRGALGS